MDKDPTIVDTNGTVPVPDLGDSVLDQPIIQNLPQVQNHQLAPNSPTPSPPHSPDTPPPRPLPNTPPLALRPPGEFT